MRRVMLLALLALALPMAAFANSIDPVFFNTGTFSNGLLTNRNVLGINAGLTAINVVGSSERFRIASFTLSSGCNTAAAGICTFSSATLEVFNPATAGTPIFTDSLTNGQILKSATTLVNGLQTYTGVLTADLAATPGLFCLRCELNIGFTINGNGHTGVTAAVGHVTGVSTIPEPSTLGLLGSGLISLAGFARRKIKLPT